jgi:hypothetical protein
MSEALNAEAVLASIVELRASLAESNAELRASIAEQGKRIDVVCERLDEQGKRLDKVVEKMDKNNSKLDENNHKLGLLTNKLGSIVESIVIPGIVEKFNEKGFKFDSVSTNVEFLNEKKNGNLAEVDALLENGKFVIAIEAKTDLSVSDVNAHIKRLQALRKVSRFKGKKIYGDCHVGFGGCFKGYGGGDVGVVLACDGDCLRCVAAYFAVAFVG